MITRIDPERFETANTVQLDSDAANNMAAIIEIDAWADANGFNRTSEYSLRQIRAGGKRYFRGVCFRIDEEERRSADIAHEEFVRRGDAFRDAVRARSGEGVP